MLVLYIRFLTTSGDRPEFFVSQKKSRVTKGLFVTSTGNTRVLEYQVAGTGL